MMNSSTVEDDDNNNNVNHQYQYYQKEVVGEDHHEDEEDDDDDVPLPGFRFHPTDEELLGFYLRRKVDKRPITSIELIKHVDIYKYDPWDLPNCKGSNVGEKEWYFYCKRGRKYKNSIRPNRVTASGFWKATGIDRPVYSSSTTGGGGGGGRQCIGLKKSLVFYRGAAGKGTKTDWMMHEFRLPPPPSSSSASSSSSSSSSSPAAASAPHHQEEAEVWTLCRILKRNLTYNNNNNNKCMPPHMAAKQPSKKQQQQQPCSRSSRNSSLDIINFRDPDLQAAGQMMKKQTNYWNETRTTATVLDIESSSSSSSNLINNNNNNDNYYYYFNYNTKYGNWDTLSSVNVDPNYCFSTSPSAAAAAADQYHPFNNY